MASHVGHVGGKHRHLVAQPLHHPDFLERSVATGIRINSGRLGIDEQGATDHPAILREFDVDALLAILSVETMPPPFEFRPVHLLEALDASGDVRAVRRALEVVNP